MPCIAGIEKVCFGPHRDGGFSTQVIGCQKPTVGNVEASGLGSRHHPQSPPLDPSADTGAQPPSCDGPIMFGSDALPANVCGAKNESKAGRGLNAPTQPLVGRIPGLPCSGGFAKCPVAFGGNSDKIHSVGVFEVVVAPIPVKGFKVVCGLVNVSADFMQGMGNFVFKMVPSRTDPKCARERDAVFDFPANSGVELRDGEGRRIQVNLRVKRRGHICGLDVVKGQVNAGSNQPKIGSAVFCPVVAPVGIPLALSLGRVYPSNGLAGGLTS